MPIAHGDHLSGIVVLLQISLPGRRVAVDQLVQRIDVPTHGSIQNLLVRPDIKGDIGIITAREHQVLVLVAVVDAEIQCNAAGLLNLFDPVQTCPLALKRRAGSAHAYRERDGFCRNRKAFRIGLVDYAFRCF